MLPSGFPSSNWKWPHKGCSTGVETSDLREDWELGARHSGAVVDRSASRDPEELQACAGPEVSPYSPPLKDGYVHTGLVTFRPAPLCRAPGLLNSAE